MNVVATPKTRAVAGRMIASSVKNSGPDAVLEHLASVHPTQIPALIGLLLTNVKVNLKPGRRRIPSRLTEKARREGNTAYKNGDRSTSSVFAYREYQRVQQRARRQRQNRSLTTPKAPRSVDEHFPLSAPLVTLVPGHDKSAPSGAVTPNLGASPTEIGHDRLMENIPLRATAAPWAVCPACGADSGGTAHDRGGVTYANYLCAAGHGWSAHWLTSATGAA